MPKEQDARKDYRSPTAELTTGTQRPDWNKGKLNPALIALKGQHQPMLTTIRNAMLALRANLGLPPAIATIVLNEFPIEIEKTDAT